MATNPLRVNPLAAPTPAPAPEPKKPFAATGLGVAANTIRGLFGLSQGGSSFAGLAPATENPYIKVATDIGNAIADTVASAGLTAQNLGTRVLQRVAQTPGIQHLGIVAGEPQSEVQMPESLRPLFGDGDIKDWVQTAVDQVGRIKANPYAQKIGLTDDRVLAPLAVGSILGRTALDLSGLGGEKAAITSLAKETDPAIIAGLLQKTGLLPDVAQKIAPAIAEATTDEEVRHILDVGEAFHGLQTLSGAENESRTLYESNRNPNLPEGLKQVEQDAFGEIQRKGGLSNMADRYIEENGKTVNTDQARELFPAYAQDRSRSAGVHEPASAVTNAAYEKLLKTEAGKGDNTVVFTGGGTGAGKTTALKLAGESLDGASVVYDGNMSTLDSSIQKIDKALKAGYNVIVHYVHRDPIEALVNGALPRAERMAAELGSGRTVPLNEHIKTHVGTPKTAVGLIEHYADDPRVQIRAVDNSNGREAPYRVASPLAFFKDKLYSKGNETELLKQAKEVLESERQAGRISEATYRGSQETPGRGGQAERRDGGGTGESPQSVTPADTLQKEFGGKESASWRSLIKGKLSSAAPKEKSHMLDYLATPEFVLEKVGLGKGAEMLQDAKLLYRKNLKKEIDQISDWRKRVGNSPYASTRIFRYLDGDARFAKSEMSADELAVAKEIKTYLKGWADRLKLPEDNRISNYITHIFDDGVVEGKLSPFEEDPELAQLMSEKPAGSVYDPFVQKRLGKKGYKEDAWAALDAYVKRGTRKEAMDPALEYLKKESAHLNESVYDYVTDLTHRINMRPTKWDKRLDNLLEEIPGIKRLAKGPRPTMALTQKIRSTFYRGALGLNFGSALRNLSQGANTYAKLGEKYTVIGYTKLFARLLTNNLGDLKEAGVLSDELIQDKKVGVYKSLLQKLDPVLFGAFELAEKINRGAAFYGAEAKALKKGLSPEEAAKYGARIVRETQFAFSAVDSPVLLGSDIAKTAFQLGTYNAKQIEFLSRMVKNREFGGLLRYTLSSLAFVYTIGRTFGMTADQLIPSVGLGGSPAGNLVTGLAGLASTDAEKRAEAKSSLQRTAVSLIPGGAQIRKSIQGIEAYNAGRDKTPTGRTRFRIPQNLGTRIRTAVFGKSSIPAAQKYYQSLGKKKSSTGKGNPLSQ